MLAVIKKIHMYLGLLCATALLVYSIAGLWAVSFVRPADRPRPAPETRFIDFQAPPNATDKQVVDLIWEAVAAPLTGKVPQFAIRRNRDHNLSTAFYSVNGLWRVTYLEKENRVQIEQSRNRLGNYFMAMHEAAPRHPAPDMRMRLWAWYNEFATWALILMPISGIYLWLGSRPEFRWAQISFALGTGGFALLYWLAR